MDFTTVIVAPNVENVYMTKSAIKRVDTVLKDASFSLSFLCVKCVMTGTITVHALQLVVIVRTKLHVIKMTEPAISTAKTTFNPPFVKIVLTGFMQKTVVQNAENVQTRKFVTKLTDHVKMAVVSSFCLLFAMNASLAFMEKTVTKRVHTAIQAHLVAIDTMATVSLAVKMEGILLIVNL